jgi:hypothetical protein
MRRQDGASSFLKETIISNYQVSHQFFVDQTGGLLAPNSCKSRAKGLASGLSKAQK